MHARFAFASAILLAGCGSDTSGTVETGDGESADYSIEPRGGDSTITIKTDEGELNIRSGADLVVDLPRGFSLYRGAEVISSTDAQHASGSMKSVMFSVKQPLSSIAEHYRSQAQSAGYEIGSQVKSDKMRLMSGKNEEGKSFTFNGTLNEDGETVVNLTFVGD